MARKRTSSLPSPTLIPIGNCEVAVEAKNFESQLDQNGLQISFSKNAKIKISCLMKDSGNGMEDRGSLAYSSEHAGDYYFVLANPRDSDEQTKSLLQEVLSIYTKELPAMNYAANTGKESMFLEKCVSNGKYCTLLLKAMECGQHGGVVGAITYQIIPADTQYAEVPLAAVSSVYQLKGIGRMLYTELRKRLHKVGIRTIFCWADKESEGFWVKQGFAVIGEVDSKGKARRLPIKADIRRTLCFPGGSTLMVSHLSEDQLKEPLKLLVPLKPRDSCCPSAIVREQESRSTAKRLDYAKDVNQISVTNKYFDSEKLVARRSPLDGGPGAGIMLTADCCDVANTSQLNQNGSETEMEHYSCSVHGTKKRTWEASHTSLNCKKVKGSHAVECQLASVTLRPDVGSNCHVADDSQKNPSSNGISSSKDEEGRIGATTVDYGSRGMISSECFRIMLMNIADVDKKSSLTKIIEELGGVVASDGSVCTHVVTGKVRKTLNFCTALCSGAWIISPSWLKESFRKCRFVAEMPFILKDEEYEAKYRTELKCAVLKAKTSPQALFKGFDLFLATRLQPPVSTLSAIVKAAGGNVIRGLDQVHEASKTIFIASEEDMEEVLSAVKKGILIFSIDWLMNCIMRQELDLDAPQFAESL